MRTVGGLKTKTPRETRCCEWFPGASTFSSLIVRATRLRGPLVVQRRRRIVRAERLERTVAKLTHTLARDAEELRDLIQRHRLIFEAVVHDEDTTIARRELLERAVQPSAARLIFGARERIVALSRRFRRDDARERLPITLTTRATERLVQRTLRRDDADQALNDIGRELRNLADFIRRRLAAQGVAKRRLCTRHARQITGAI